MNPHKPRIYLITTRSIKVIISSIYLSADCLLALFCRLLGIKRKTICIIVCYHTVMKEDLAKFKKQINFLMRHTTTIDPSDIHEIEGDTRYSVVTFDDGLFSFLKNASPILEAHQIPAINFIPAGMLGERPRWIKSVATKRNSKQLLSDRVMSSSELKKLNFELFTIGSHGLTHKPMITMKDSELRYELTSSKALLENTINMPIKYMSFPNGKYNTEVLEACREAGYECAFSIEPLTVKAGDRNSHIGRIVVDPDDWAFEYRLKMLGYYSWIVPFREISGTLKRIIKAPVNHA